MAFQLRLASQVRGMCILLEVCAYMSQFEPVRGTGAWWAKVAQVQLTREKLSLWAHLLETQSLAELEVPCPRVELQADFGRAEISPVS